MTKFGKNSVGCLSTNVPIIGEDEKYLETSCRFIPNTMRFGEKRLHTGSEADSVTL